MVADENQTPQERPTTMRSDSKEGAWLETSGDKFPICGDCSLGRSPKNAIVLDSQKVSRRHAIIHVQNVGEFWLIDLGSSNGTFLNHRRLNQPVRLSDQDQVVIGDRIFIFHQPEDITDDYRTTFAQRTIREVEHRPCWLLVADIEDFTPLSRSLTSDCLATLIGGWVATCKEIIESNEGTIDKYLGDGFLAYWREAPSATKNVAAALSQLKEAQARSEPRFRIALHFGFVAIGGIPSMGEESLMGKEVNFVFRMEKLAGSLGIAVLTSAAGQSKLKSLLQFESASAHELKGFEGKHEFFSC
jgi:adenylate cyclase